METADMHATAVLSISALVLVAACGSSTSTTTASSPLKKGEVLRTFQDSSGIARLVSTEDGVVIVNNVIGADIKRSVSEFTDGVDTASEVKNERLTVQLANSLRSTGRVSDNYGRYLSGSIQGTAVLNGVDTPGEASVTVFVDKSGQASTAFMTFFGFRQVEAAGIEVSNIPTGEFVYTGRNFMEKRPNSTVDTGTFEMTVDFGKGTGEFEGTTLTASEDKYLSSLAGDVTVDVTDGTFAGQDLDLKYFKGGVADPKIYGPAILDAKSASIYGNFHGEGAVAVSGVYADNDLVPTYVGAIAGSVSQSD